MSPRSKLSRERGFGLVELLVAVAIVGVVVAAMYSVFINMKRTTVDQEEIVDLQQDLRIALDALARDVQMAGFLVPPENPAIAIAGADTLRLQTASPYYAFAQIEGILTGFEIPAGTTPSSEFMFSVSDREMVDYFEGGQSVRIIRPETGRQPFEGVLTVQATDPGVPAITVKGFNTAQPVRYKRGDIIVRVVSGTPVTISWRLAGTDLQRSTDGVQFETIAPDVKSVKFSYLLEDGSELVAVTDEQRERIVAIHVLFEAATSRQLDKAVRERTLASVIRLRN